MSLHRALGGLEQQWSRAYEQHAGCEAIALTIHTREPLDLGLATVPLLTTLTNGVLQGWCRCACRSCSTSAHC